MENFNSEYISHFDGNFFARVFMEMPCGAAYLQLLFDDEGKPIDYVTLEVNPFFLQLMGISKDKVIGRRASDQLSQAELTHWLEIFAPVASGTTALSTTMYAHSKKRKFQVTSISPQKSYFCLFFSECRVAVDQQ